MPTKTDTVPFIVLRDRPRHSGRGGCQGVMTNAALTGARPPKENEDE